MGAPSIKVMKVETFRNKISLTGCKLSNSNAPGSEHPVSQSLLEESLFPFPAHALSFLPLFGVIRNGSSQYEGHEGGKIWEQNQFNRLQIVQFECPRVSNPCVLITVGGISFPISSPCQFLPYSLWGNKKWELPV